MDELALKIQYELSTRKFLYTAIRLGGLPDAEFISQNVNSNDVDVISLTIGRQDKDFDFWTADFGLASEKEVIPKFYMSFRDKFTVVVYGWQFVVTGLDESGKVVPLSKADIKYILEELRIWS